MAGATLPPHLTDGSRRMMKEKDTVGETGGATDAHQTVCCSFCLAPLEGARDL